MRIRPKVIIESAKRWDYFQWFLLGFYELERNGFIDLEISCSIAERNLLWIQSKFAQRVGNRLLREYRKRWEDSYEFVGMIEYPNGSTKNFCIDSADAPFLFDRDLLERSDAYFKMQCPIRLNPEGFRLSNNVIAPWCEHQHQDSSLGLTERGGRKVFPDLVSYSEKIHPLMIGPRRLSFGNSFRSLQQGYENYTSAYTSQKKKRIMCYFGNAEGPRLEQNVSRDTMDWDWEADILSAYDGVLEHPNVKRARIADLIASLEEGADARVISRGVADSSDSVKDTAKIVPLEEFCAFVAQFQYNTNISGYRLSIPNRFIESFMVGTSIFTDQCAVKWYLPFDSCEVIETGRMGYELDADVDWSRVLHDLQNLPETDPAEVYAAFERKWRPDVVAKYIVDTVGNQL
ncbi:hypothetical protein [uncultured Selenomonas sp.]|uniref:hypothetical protein n=1 Tax=uncultured Selenomonas sp. TaxID=159275 RepID=UPI0028ED6E7B|nr:hypothetical protein [uncultured Selenomonas sp.]